MSDSNEPAAIVEATGVPGKNIFFLGCFESRVTVLSQQRRALNLVDALIRSGIVRQKGRVAIVGGGAAGVTAAAAFAVTAQDLQAIHLYEQESMLLHLQQQSHRHLHPHLYDWPTPGSKENNAGLPILNWNAGTAHEVASQILEGFRKIRSGSRCLDVRTQRPVSGIDPVDKYCRLRVEGERDPYDAAIIAVGFGYEKEISGENHSYWTPSPLTGPLESRANGQRILFISGNGDGGLVDFAMAAFNRKSHAEITSFVIEYPGLEKTQEALLEIENRAWSDREDNLDLLAEYQNLPLPQHLLLDVSENLRPDVEVWLHSREPRLFRRTSAILNRFTAFLAITAASRFGRNKIRVFTNRSLGGTPREGPIDMGDGPIVPLHRFLRFGPNKEHNFRPFEQMIREYRHDHSAPFETLIDHPKRDQIEEEVQFRLATPQLTESADELFGSPRLASKRLLVSYASADEHWAKWIKCEIEEGTEYRCFLQQWDFPGGRNSAAETRAIAKECQRSIIVVTQNYFSSKFSEEDWISAFGANRPRQHRHLLGVRVAACEPGQLFDGITSLNLTNLDEISAREKLLAAIKNDSTGLPLADAQQKRPPYPGISSRHWLVPDRNDFFTGRTDVLANLHQRLVQYRRAAITGMGGVGKTQTVIEYAHRHREEYQAVFFIQAQTETSITAGIIDIAKELDLPARDAQIQNATVADVKRWLSEHHGWLFIADNLDSVELARSYLPNGPGHLLLTTRAPALGGFADCLKLKKMDTDEGAHLLLRRAGRLGKGTPLADLPEVERESAKSLTQEMDGLPLALDQAGAFIEDMGSSPAEYLQLYSSEGKRLRSWTATHGSFGRVSVTLTFSLAFAKIAEASPVAADLLRLSAFLAPDEIPEAVLTKGSPDLGASLEPAAADDLARIETLGHACRFSLVSRDANTRTFSIHRQVQAVLRDGMTPEEKVLWATRAVRTVNWIFPRPNDFSVWPICQATLPHALGCVDYIRLHNLEFLEAASLLNKSGDYLFRRGRYAEADLLCGQALTIGEKALGLEHPETAYSVYILGLVSLQRGDLAKAEVLSQRALAIREGVLGPEHPDTASSLNVIAGLNRRRGNLSLAEEICRRALKIRETVLGPEHTDTVSTVNNLAGIYYDLGNFTEAETLFRRAERVLENAPRIQLPTLGIVINNLGETYYRQGKLSDAEAFFRKAIAIKQEALGSQHISTAISLKNLAKLCEDQGRLTEAEQFFSRGIDTIEKAVGWQDLELAASLEQYASLLRKIGRPDEATKLESRAEAIRNRDAKG